MHKILILTIIIPFFIGCGGGSSTQPLSSSEEEIRIPENLSIDIPKIFVLDEDLTQEFFKINSKQIIEEVFIESINYKIAFQDKETSILAANYALDDILSHCKDTPINTACEIPKETITFTISQNFIDELLSIGTLLSNSIDRQILLNETVSLGEVQFTQYDDSHSYQYQLKIDLTALDDIIFGTDTNNSYNFQWSKDNSKLIYLYSQRFEDQEIYFNKWTYQQVSETSKQVSIVSRNLGDEEVSDNLSFETFTQNDESNITYLSTLNKMYIEEIAGELFTDQFLTQLLLTNDGGFNFYNRSYYLSSELSNRGIYEDLFDNNGTVFSSIGCLLEDTECNLYDPSTWQESQAYSSLIDINYKDLNIEGGELKEGVYYFLPSDFNKTLTIENVVVSEIGNFMVYKNQRQGTVNKKAYQNNLDTLKIVYIKDTHSNNIFSEDLNDEPFEYVSKEQMPQLYYSNGI